MPNEELFMNNLWPRLEAQLRIHAPDLASRLRPGASEAEIAAYEAETGQALPEELRLSYLRHDGCEYLDNAWRSSPEALLGWFQWQPLQESLKEWRSWQALFPDDEPYFCGDEQDTAPWAGRAIRPWSTTPPSCIPVGRFVGGSSRLFVDVLPGPAGAAGQIVLDDVGRRIWANGWFAYLGELTLGLEAGLIQMYPDPNTGQSYWRVISTELDFRAPGHSF
jgi:cell wall assembly regulator SMI1